MLPFLRMAKVLLLPAGPKADLFEGASVRFRVWPNDLDLNLHMNNSRYFALMDLGRYDLVRRAGFWQEARKRGWNPVVAAQRIRFRRSLANFRTFELHTRLLGWDERTIFMQQEFRQGGEVCAQATVRAVFIGRGGRRIMPAELMTAIRWHASSPPLPPHVQAWADAEDAGRPSRANDPSLP